MRVAVRRFGVTLEELPGKSVQDRWDSFEETVWPLWHAGESRSGEDDWRWGTWAAVLTRTVRPSWQFIESGRVGQWTLRLPEHDGLLAASRELQDMISAVAWSSEVARRDAWWLGLRVLLMSGAASAAELTDETFEVAGAAKDGTCSMRRSCRPAPSSGDRSMARPGGVGYRSARLPSWSILRLCPTVSGR